MWWWDSLLNEMPDCESMQTYCRLDTICVMLESIQDFIFKWYTHYLDRNGPALTHVMLLMLF